MHMPLDKRATRTRRRQEFIARLGVRSREPGDRIPRVVDHSIGWIIAQAVFTSDTSLISDDFASPKSILVVGA